VLLGTIGMVYENVWALGGAKVFSSLTELIRCASLSLDLKIIAGSDKLVGNLVTLLRSKQLGLSVGKGRGI